MPIDFTPQFFSRTSPKASAPVKGSLAQEIVSGIEQRKYSPEHKLERNNPLSQRAPSLLNASERYADIDWTKHKVVMQDGSEIKFGQSYSDATKDAADEDDKTLK